MSWPNPADYQEAIQHPDLCFSDPELKSGTPLTDRWGLPRPVSGAFASVYQMDSKGQKHAVRCFLRYVPDIERRYAIISDHLSRSRLPYIVEFKYLSQGIRVRGQWYPILKMDWVEGERLDTYVARNLNNSAALFDLAQKFFKLARDLKRASIAHGDLQHGNILVVKGELRLIDYDGMYVPGLAGWKSNEVGQPNYQHPRRSANDFGLYLDHFSEWVIYLTLVALAVDPTLRSRFTFGNEYLLLSRADYLKPGASSVFQVLERDRDQSVRSMIARLVSFLSSADLSRIPGLDANLSARPMPAASGQKPGWLADYTRPEPSPRAPGKGASPAAGPTPQRNPAVAASPGGGWLRDQLPAARAAANPSSSAGPLAAANPLAAAANPLTAALLLPVTPVELSSAPTIERILLALTMIGMALIGLALTAGVLDGVLAAELVGTAAALTAGGLGVRYKTLPEIRRRDELLTDLARLDREIQRGERKTERLDSTLARLHRQEEEQTERLTADQRDSKREEVEELKRVQDRLQARVTAAGQRRQKLSQGEVEESRRALADLQNRALADLLRGFELGGESIAGVPPAVLQRLRSLGIHTAADVLDIQPLSGRATPAVSVTVPFRGVIMVEGITAEQARLIRLWRRGLEQRFAGQVPAALPLSQQAWIKGKYELQRRLVDYDENRARQTARQDMDMTHVSSQQRREQLARRLQDVPTRFAPRRQELAQQVIQVRQDLSGQQAEQSRLEREVAPYRGLNFAEYVRHIF